MVNGVPFSTNAEAFKAKGVTRVRRMLAQMLLQMIAWNPAAATWFICIAKNVSRCLPFVVVNCAFEIPVSEGIYTGISNHGTNHHVRVQITSQAKVALKTEKNRSLKIQISTSFRKFSQRKLDV